MILYRLRNTREGRKREELPAGTLTFEGGQLVLDVPDRKLAQRILALFGETYRVRAVRGSPETFFAHTWIDLPPGSEQHFDEGLRRLVRLELDYVEG
jgi:hypothetical protein